MVIDAVQLINTMESIKECEMFINGLAHMDTGCGGSDIHSMKWKEYCDKISSDGGMKIKTLEGIMFASFGDFIIRGIEGEFYPCKPSIFEKNIRSIN